MMSPVGVVSLLSDPDRRIEGIMVGCRRCRQFGFTHLPLGSKKFRQWLAHYRVTTTSFHEFLSSFAYPRTKIRFCPCCGSEGDWFYEPGLHYGSGECRPDGTATPAEVVLMQNNIHPLYWEYALTGNPRFDLGIPCDGISPYFGPGGNTWQRTIEALAAMTPAQ